MNKLEQIFISDKIHLTFSEKKFVKETIKIFKIFFHNIEDLIYEKFKKITSATDDKIKNKNEFLDFLYSLRYPISWQKIKELKKINNKIPLNLDFEEQKFFENNLEEVQKVINKI